MAKWKKREVRKLIYGTLAAYLETESIVDEDDQEFIDIAWPIQQQIAKSFAKKAGK